MTTHTPGPWLFEQWGSRIVDSRKGSSQSLIATVAVNTYHDEGRHNARLIAAAPDLLAALQEMVADFGPTLSDKFRSLGPARAAIARATGSAADTPKIRADSGIYCGDTACSGCISGDGNCMHSTEAAS